ncbi:MAG TPA: hypothetical protein VGF34_19770 [Stellaceae bacterium]
MPTIGERRTRRTIWPLAMAYHLEATPAGDRVGCSTSVFPQKNGKLMAEWLALRKDRPDGRQMPDRKRRSAP